MNKRNSSQYILGIFLALLIFASCGSKKSEILEPELPRSINLLNLDSSELLIASDLEVRGDERGEGLNDLLEEFYNIVIIKINKSGEAYDAKVHFEKISDLRTGDDADDEYRLLTSLIEKRFEIAKIKNFSRKEKMAFYINAYNYMSIQVVAKNYIKEGLKVLSIQDLSREDIGPAEIFSRDLFLIAGDFLSLMKIEEKVRSLSKVNREKVDPRYHFALACVSSGCPPPVRGSYRAKSLDKQLSLITKRSLRLQRIVNQTKDTNEISELFLWYRSDFGTKKDSITRFIKKYRSNYKSRKKVGHKRHDWSLNFYDSAVDYDNNNTNPTVDKNGETVSQEVIINNEDIDDDDLIDDEDKPRPKVKREACHEMAQAESMELLGSCRQVSIETDKSILKYPVRIEKAHFCVMKKGEALFIRGRWIERNGISGYPARFQYENSAVFKEKDEKVLYSKKENKVLTTMKFDPEEGLLSFEQKRKGIFLRQKYRKANFFCD